MTQPRALLEVCVDSVAGACAARDGGADRLELCAELPVGGLTPSLGLLAEVRNRVDLPLHVLIRPRSGGFVFTPDELDVMTRDITLARATGAQGVVLGALTASGEVDRELTTRLMEAARPMSVTFHRAFDFTADPLDALETLATLGIERVLTSGGKPSVPEGLDALAALVRAAGQRVIVMPGGGVRSEDVGRILLATGARELHASASSRSAVSVADAPGAPATADIRLGAADGGHGPRATTDVEEVRRMVTALHAHHALR